MQFSASDLISQALRLLGVLAQGRAPSDAQGAAGLVSLNEMVDLWAIEGRVSILSFTRTAFPLTASTQSYTIGTGGAFNITRPTYLEDAGIIPDTTLAAASQSELPCDRLTEQQWAKKVDKQSTNAYPMELYYDKGFDASQLGTITFWPVPTGAAVSAVLYTPTILGQFANLATLIYFAPGYPRALVTNLALVLGPEYGRDASDAVKAEAKLSKGLIETANLTFPVLRLDAAIAGRARGFDLRSGRWR